MQVYSCKFQWNIIGHLFQYVVFTIFLTALGSGPVCKWGVDQSPLAKAIGNIGPFAVAGFNASYSDAGLVGFVLSVPKDEAGVVSIHIDYVEILNYFSLTDFKKRDVLRYYPHHLWTDFEDYFL